MSVPELCIRRPVMTTLIMIGLVAFGLMAYQRLPVSALPTVDFPTISVSASLPGASPDTMASSVATPLEKQFSTIAGIDSMVSSSGLGSTSITLQFALSRSIDDAALDVQTAISSASRSLPSTMPAPPSFRKVNPAEQSILLLALKSETLPLSKVDQYAQTLLAPRILAKQRLEVRAQHIHEHDMVFRPEPRADFVFMQLADHRRELVEPPDNGYLGPALHAQHPSQKRLPQAF